VVLKVKTVFMLFMVVSCLNNSIKSITAITVRKQPSRVYSFTQISKARDLYLMP